MMIGRRWSARDRGPAGSGQHDTGQPTATALAEAGPLVANAVSEVTRGRWWRWFVADDPGGADRWLELRLLTKRPVPPSVATIGRRGMLRRFRATGSQPSLWVALVGPDGAGKSSLAEALAQSLAVPVSLYYGGLYPVGRRRYPLKGLGTAATLLRLWRTTALATVASRRGRVVIFDRHPLDARLRVRGRDGRLARWRSAVLARACPRPDVLVVLDASVEVLHGRRREQSADLLEAQRDQYLELARTVPGGVVVDAAAELDEVRRRVTDVIWTAYAAKRARAR